MIVPTIILTNGKAKIRVNTDDEKRFEAQGYKRPAPADPEKKPEAEKKT